MNVTVRIRVIAAHLPASAKPSEITHATDGASVVELGSTSTPGGSVTFSNVVVEGGVDDGSRSPLRAMVGWTCGPAGPVAPEG
jgi:hypothetical protein